MKYDDASWHYGGDFPADLPPSAGATHIGMFFAWCLLTGLGNPNEECDFSGLDSRSITPGQFIVDEYDEKFMDFFLNSEGNEFAAFYYEFETGQYIHDYTKVLAENLPTAYHAADNWENYDALIPILDQRFAQWKSDKQSTLPSQSFFSKVISKLTKKHS